MQKITSIELLNLLTVRKGAYPVAFIAHTEPKMRKTGNPYVGNVVKVSRINATINHNYENSVNRQQLREGSDGDFQAEKRTWGVRIAGTPIVEHKGEHYLSCKINGVIDRSFQTLDGTPVAESELAPFLVERADNAARQGVEREVIVADYKIGGIKQISMNGEQYSIA